MTKDHGTETRQFSAIASTEMQARAMKVVLSFLFFIQFGVLIHKIVSPYLGWVFLPQFNKSRQSFIVVPRDLFL